MPVYKHQFDFSKECPFKVPEIVEMKISICISFILSRRIWRKYLNICGECIESILAYSVNMRKAFEAYMENIENLGLFVVLKFVSESAECI